MERESFRTVVLVGRLREAIRQLNPTIPEVARGGALSKLLHLATPSLQQTNLAFHRMLRDGWLGQFTGVLAGASTRESREAGHMLLPTVDHSRWPRLASGQLAAEIQGRC